MTPPDPTAADLPRRCGACGYALAGLRSVGACPECGEPFDHADGRVLLFGWRRGVMGDPATTRTDWMWRVLPSELLVAFMFYNFWRTGGANVVTWILLLSVIQVVYGWVVLTVRRSRATAGGAVPPVRVALAPEGFASADGKVPKTLHPWRRADRIGLYAPVAWSDVLNRPRSPARRHRLRVRPAGVGWWRFERVGKGRWFRRDPLAEPINIEFDATPAQAAALLRRLEAWRDGSA